MRPIFKLSYYIAITLLIVIFSYLVGKQDRHYPEPFKIRNIGETQQQLIDAGYEWVIVDGNWAQVTVDYIWGPITDAAYCQSQSDISMAKMERK